MIPRPHAVPAVLLTTALVLGLAACGDDDSDDAATDTTETTAGTTETTEGTEGTDAAAGEAVATVFDSSVAFDDKVTLIEGGESHRADHDGYVGAAQAVGGISVEPTDVAVDGATATVTYRVLFGGNEAYAGLTMDVAQVGGSWIVPTTAFCGFLASARTPCATSG